MHKDIIAVEGKLTPLSSKTHTTYQFHLDHPLSSLEIDFRYAPKQFSDREASQPLILEVIETNSDPAWVELHKKQWETNAIYFANEYMDIDVDAVSVYEVKKFAALRAVMPEDGGA